MTSTSVSAALSFRPWTRGSTDTPPLKDLLAQLNHERGHFRNVTEASLQDELAADGALPLSESSDDDDEQDSVRQKKQPTTRQQLYSVKTDLWTRASEAHEQIMLALDMMSLLESKYAPAQSKITMSQALSAATPAGTLAADVWHRMPSDDTVKAREAQDNLLASKVRTSCLQQSANDLLSASKRLEDNVRRETMFWDQILAVTHRRWNVSRIPTGQRGQQRLLGVHFGFAGCRPEFTRGIAALIPDSEGNIKLERGIGTKPKSIRVTLKKDGELLGRSTMPTLPDMEETTLEARTRYARDSVYDEELYYEMLREARTLRSYDVTMKHGITIPLQDNTLEVELVSLGESGSGLTAAYSTLHVAVCNAAALAFRLMLSRAHREALHKRSEVPPALTEKSEDKVRLQIILPIMEDSAPFAV